MEENITYQQFIQNIINTRGNFGITSGYKERHHIIPKCLGGPNSLDNLIDLTAQEHYEAHKLLFKENPNNRYLALAWHNFHQRKASKNTPAIEISADDYAILREQYSKLQHYALSGKNSPSYGLKRSDETKEKIKSARLLQSIYLGEPHSGKYHSVETKQYLSEHFMSCPSHSVKIIDINSGKVYISKSECIRQIGISKKILTKCLKNHLPWQNYQLEILEDDKSIRK